MAYSPDGRLLVSTSNDRTVRLWDLQSGIQIHLMQGHTNDCKTVTFSPDGRTVASAGWDGTVRIWNPVTAEEMGQLHVGRGTCSSIAFAPNGSTLVVAVSSGIQLWDAKAGKKVREWADIGGIVESVAFSPDGKTIAAAASDKLIHLLRNGSQNESQSLHGHERFVYSVAFFPDGKRLVSGSFDQTVRVWDLQNSEEIVCLSDHGSIVRSVAVSPDGAGIAAGTDDGSVIVWDVATENQTGCFKHEAKVMHVTYSPDSRYVASASDDRTIRIWNVSSPAIQPLRPVGHKSTIAILEFSPDGRYLATGGYDRTLRVWDGQVGREVACLQPHPFWVDSIAWTKSSMQLVARSSNMVKLWNWREGRCTLTIDVDQSRHPATYGNLRCVTITPGGEQIVSGSDDGTLQHWDARTGRRLLTHVAHAGEVVSVAASPDGRFVATTDHRQIGIWNIADQRGRKLTLPPASMSTAVRFSTDGEQVLVGSWSPRAVPISAFSIDSLARAFEITSEGIYPSLAGLALGMDHGIFTGDSETAVVSLHDLKPLAWLQTPMSMVKVCATNGNTWAGVADKQQYLHMFVVEDDPRDSHGR